MDANERAADAYAHFRNFGGDREFYAQIYDLARPILYRIAIARCPNDADDIVQETFMRFADAIRKGKLDLTETPLMPWMIKVEKRLMVDLWRKTRRLCQLSDLAPGKSQTEDYLLWKAVAGLPAGQREALTLWADAGMTAEEIAAATGQPASKIRHYMREGKKTILEGKHGRRGKAQKGD